jgi:uncharacterized protein YabN with tetrapyrrole methylase and pyrophosphatase domain
VTGGPTGLGAEVEAALVGDAAALGEALCALARAAADAGVDAEEACRRAAERFRDRFSRAERLAAVEGTSLAATGEAERRRYFAAAAPEAPDQEESSFV